MDLMSMLQPKTVEEQPKKELKEKKTRKPATKKEKTENGGKKYKYPFNLYLAAEKRDVSHIFNEGVEYTQNEITSAMLQHGYYEFSGNVTYDYMEEDNTLVPTFQQHKKG